MEDSVKGKDRRFPKEQTKERAIMPEVEVTFQARLPSDDFKSKGAEDVQNDFDVLIRRSLHLILEKAEPSPVAWKRIKAKAQWWLALKKIIKWYPQYLI